MWNPFDTFNDDDNIHIKLSESDVQPLLNACELVIASDFPGKTIEVIDCMTKLKNQILKQMPSPPPPPMSIEQLRELYPLPPLNDNNAFKSWTTETETIYLRLQESKRGGETLIICDCGTMFNTNYPLESMPPQCYCPNCRKCHCDQKEYKHNPFNRTT